MNVSNFDYTAGVNSHNSAAQFATRTIETHENNSHDVDRVQTVVGGQSIVD